MFNVTLEKLQVNSYRNKGSKETKSSGKCFVQGVVGINRCNERKRHESEVPMG